MNTTRKNKNHKISLNRSQISFLIIISLVIVSSLLFNNQLSNGITGASIGCADNSPGIGMVIMSIVFMGGLLGYILKGKKTSFNRLKKINIKQNSNMIIVILLLTLTMLTGIFCGIFDCGITGMIVGYDADFNITNQANFDLGTYDQTFFNTSTGAVEIDLSFVNGTYLSEILSPGALAQWNNISWYNGHPYGEPLPCADKNESVTKKGGIDMTGNSHLFPMDETGEAPGLNNFERICGGENPIVKWDATATQDCSVAGVHGTGCYFPGAGNGNSFYRMGDLNLDDNDLTFSFWLNLIASNMYRGSKVVCSTNSFPNAVQVLSNLFLYAI